MFPFFIKHIVFCRWTNYVPAFLKTGEKYEERNNEMVASAQKVFLKLINYFLEDG